MLFSTEQVSKYHPDKYADQISDAILSECLRQDPNSHCGIETMVKNDIVVLGGEITSEADFDIEKVVRGVAEKLDYKVGAVVNLLSKQSPEINNAVMSEENIGAGDQGMMFGYATNETESKLPFGFDLANRIIAAIENDIAENPNTISAAMPKRKSPSIFLNPPIWKASIPCSFPSANGTAIPSLTLPIT